MLVLFCLRIPLSLGRHLVMDLKLPHWELSEDEIQTAPILGKIKTVLEGKIEGGDKSPSTGHEKPGTHKPKVE